MNEDKKIGILDEKTYSNQIHMIGRVGSALLLMFMLGIPFVIGTVYDCMPKFSWLIQPSIALLAMMGPTSVSEVLGYAPVLGSGNYIAFITGNIMNLKLPAAISAHALAGVQPNTPEGDAVGTMAIAISSIITVIICAIGVLVFIPMQPILTSAAFKTASNYLVHALMGSMILNTFGKGKGKTVIKNKLMLPLVAIAMSVAGVLLIPKFSSYQGYAMLVAIVITIGWAYLLYKKGVVKVVNRDEK